MGAPPVGYRPAQRSQPSTRTERPAAAPPCAGGCTARRRPVRGGVAATLACLLHKREHKRKAGQAEHGCDDGKELGGEAGLVLGQLLPAGSAGKRSGGALCGLKPQLACMLACARGDSRTDSSKRARVCMAAARPVASVLQGAPPSPKHHCKHVVQRIPGPLQEPAALRSGSVAGGAAASRIARCTVHGPEARPPSQPCTSWCSRGSQQAGEAHTCGSGGMVSSRRRMRPASIQAPVMKTAQHRMPQAGSNAVQLGTAGMARAPMRSGGQQPRLSASDSSSVGGSSGSPTRCVDDQE